MENTSLNKGYSIFEEENVANRIFKVIHMKINCLNVHVWKIDVISENTSSQLFEGQVWKIEWRT